MANSGEDPTPDDYAIKEEDGDENRDMHAPLPTRPATNATLQTPVRRTLGSFMTPQVPVRSQPLNNTLVQPRDIDGNLQPGRFSLGGGEARRVVRTEQVWRVKDIVVPFAGGPVANNASVPENKFVRSGVLGTAPNAGTGVLGSPVRRKVVGDEERKVIFF
jgi:hypothetical protein